MSAKIFWSTCKKYFRRDWYNNSNSKIFTVYGPFGRPDMSILRFVHWISTSQEVIVYGDGQQKRAFTFISDIISGLNKLFSHSDSGVFNFGSNETHLNQVMNLLKKILIKKP